MVTARFGNTSGPYLYETFHESMDGVALELVLISVAPMRTIGYVDVESADMSTVELENPVEFPGKSLSGISVGTPPDMV
jgi:hypothetical protein